MPDARHLWTLALTVFPIAFESIFCHLVSIDQPRGSLKIWSSLLFDKHFGAEKAALHFIHLIEPMLLGNQWENRSFWVKRLYIPRWEKNDRFHAHFYIFWSCTSLGLPGLVKVSGSHQGSFQSLETGRELGWGFQGLRPTGPLVGAGRKARQGSERHFRKISGRILFMGWAWGAKDKMEWKAIYSNFARLKEVVSMNTDRRFCFSFLLHCFVFREPNSEDTEKKKKKKIDKNLESNFSD